MIKFTQKTRKFGGIEDTFTIHKNALIKALAYGKGNNSSEIMQRLIVDDFIRDLFYKFGRFGQNISPIYKSIKFDPECPKNQSQMLLKHINLDDLLKDINQTSIEQLAESPNFGSSLDTVVKEIKKSKANPKDFFGEDYWLFKNKTYFSLSSNDAPLESKLKEFILRYADFVIDGIMPANINVAPKEFVNNYLLIQLKKFKRRFNLLVIDDDSSYHKLSKRLDKRPDAKKYFKFLPLAVAGFDEEKTALRKRIPLKLCIYLDSNIIEKNINTKLEEMHKQITNNFTSTQGYSSDSPEAKFKKQCYRILQDLPSELQDNVGKYFIELPKEQRKSVYNLLVNKFYEEIVIPNHGRYNKISLYDAFKFAYQLCGAYIFLINSVKGELPYNTDKLGELVNIQIKANPNLFFGKINEIEKLKKDNVFFHAIGLINRKHKYINLENVQKNYFMLKQYQPPSSL